MAPSQLLTAPVSGIAGRVAASVPGNCTRRPSRLALQSSRSLRDHRQHAGRVAEDIVVPEPQNLETMRGQHIGAHAVAPLPARGSMLPAVQLDDQAEFDTGEVSKVGGHWVLAPKPQAAQPATTQVVPEPVLGISLPLAQAPSEITLIVG